MEGRAKMTAKEEREILIKKLKRLINEASNYELRCAYILLLNISKHSNKKTGLYWSVSFFIF